MREQSNAVLPMPIQVSNAKVGTMSAHGGRPNVHGSIGAAMAGWFRGRSVESQWSRMKTRHLAFLLLIPCASALAEGGRVGFELEFAKYDQTGVRNRAATVAPGWDFAAGSLISSVELLVEKNRDMAVDGDGVRASEDKLFLRLRHDGEIADRLDYYVRGGVGHSSNSVQDFRYAYVEPGVEYEFADRWSWAVAYRGVNSIDGVQGQRSRELYLGPSVDMGKHNEFEFRYGRATGDHNVKLWVLEYVHKFQ
jgi:hypothetical protein